MGANALFFTYTYTHAEAAKLLLLDARFDFIKMKTIEW